MPYWGPRTLAASRNRAQAIGGWQIGRRSVCKLGLEGIVSKKFDAPYKSGPSKAWLKI